MVVFGYVKRPLFHFFFVLSVLPIMVLVLVLAGAGIAVGVVAGILAVVVLAATGDIGAFNSPVRAPDSRPRARLALPLCPEWARL